MGDTSAARNAWETAQPFPGSPPDNSERHAIDTPDGRYWELNGSGWDAMLGYLADPATLVRFAETRQHQIKVTIIDRAGERTFFEPRTADDQAIIDEAANSYLHDVGLPQQPTGYRWFQRLPDGLTVRDIEKAVYAAIEHLPPDHHPAEAVPAIRAALARLYHARRPSRQIEE
ncbi:DUF5956 family protein [Micromonospora okii]|uniref:Dehydorgenase n=1 Tax=Micromonospora okii TaxID=1182970 RepID=A0A023GUI7_9ACTN|nr:DUF5956 family protein [Micromonospora okii]AFJ52690.1 dehydorgenase [Micromonospora okii]